MHSVEFKSPSCAFQTNSLTRGTLRVRPRESFDGVRVLLLGTTSRSNIKAMPRMATPPSQQVLSRPPVRKYQKGIENPSLRLHPSQTRTSHFKRPDPNRRGPECVRC